MSIFADAIQPHLTRGLISIRGRIAAPTLPDLITAGGGVAYEVDFDNEEGAVVLDFRHNDPIANAIAGDVSRFSCAAFQSIVPLETELLERDRVAWCMIKLYYSAFYAGHAILRMVGESCSNFDKTHIDRLSVMGQAFGKVPTFGITTGMYRCVVNPDGTTLTWSPARGGKGGPHQAFWGTFGDTLGRLSDAILRGPLSRPNALAVADKIDTLRRIASSNNAHFHHWLSVLRNEVQYRHGQGVWYPSSLKKHDREYLSRLCSAWITNPEKIPAPSTGAGTLVQFAVACTLIISFCRVLLVRISEISGPRSFVIYGPFSFLKDAGYPPSQ